MGDELACDVSRAFLLAEIAARATKVAREARGTDEAGLAEVRYRIAASQLVDCVNDIRTEWLRAQACSGQGCPS